HSFADTANQVFLRISLWLGQREPDKGHPFGYGKERFFWALMAAMFIFVSGAAFSIGEGIFEWVGGSVGAGSFTVAYVILGVSLVAESASLYQAVRQIRGQARAAGLPVREFVSISHDPTVKTVASEDSAAVTGVLIAFIGVALHQATGDARWDAGASIVIGLLLVVVAFNLGRDSRGLLLGEAALPADQKKIREIIEGRS